MCQVTIMMLRLKRYRWNTFASVIRFGTVIINDTAREKSALQQGVFISPIIPQSSRNNTVLVTTCYFYVSNSFTKEPMAFQTRHGIMERNGRTRTMPFLGRQGVYVFHANKHEAQALHNTLSYIWVSRLF
jgi:hypothetical protein